MGYKGSILLQQDWDNNSNKLEGVLQLSGRAVV